MALESDKTTEARRKALRNGEEDPVVVAQRFLNIYRQMHILSPERKEGFNKMLLELSPEIRGLFSSLPGGAMLQDYADELAEKSGVQRSVHTTTTSPKMSEEAHQQAQILATALAKAQAQAQPQVQVQPQPQAFSGANGVGVVAAPSKLSLDKDFAAEFAKIIGGLIEEQTNTQKEGLDKLTADLSKVQLYLAQSMEKNREDQRQEINTLCKTIADSSKIGAVLQSRELKNICQTITENYRIEREEQHQEISALCQTIAQSQNSINASLAAFAQAFPSKSLSSDNVASNDTVAQKLIEVVLEGQKQLNLRLDKVEATSLSRANDNKELIAAFEKSQTEVIKSLSNINIGTSNVSRFEANDEKLLKLIGDSQEKLVQAVLSANIQQNNTSQANNNANNIQINTTDNSAQILLLVDKISALQAANDQNLEKAISKAIKEQSKLYDRISARQTKELAEIFAQSLKEISLPVYNVAPPVYNQNRSEFITDEASLNNVAEDSYESANYNSEIVNEENISETVDNFIPRETEEETSTPAKINEIVATDNFSEAEAPVKKKKKKKKKKKQTDEIVNNLVSESKEDTVPLDDIISEMPQPKFLEEEISPVEETISAELSSQEEAKSDSPSPFKTNKVDDILSSEDKAENILQEEQSMSGEETSEETSDIAQDSSISSSGEDWGFSPVPEKPEAPTDNSNDNADEDWEWVYVNDEQEEIPYMEAIGDNSYICSSDLYGQEKVVDDNPPIYQTAPLEISDRFHIFDNTDDNDFVDPYQNSVLKD